MGIRATWISLRSHDPGGMLRRIVAGLLLSGAIAAAPVVSAQEPRRYAGRSVAAVLQELQSAGLAVIFSSDLVTPGLRVHSEPTGRRPREVALEILTPHGLTLREGPRGTLLVVRVSGSASPAPQSRRPAASAPAKEPPGESAASSGPARLEEHVDVIERVRQNTIGSSTYTVAPSTIRETAGGFENVFQVLQLLPGAAAINDEEGRLAVRGAGPEHNVVVLDGVQIYNPYRFGELTSSFLNPATAAAITLDASGLDASQGGRLSSVTTIETRDGARDRPLTVMASLGLASGDVLVEGRLPKSDSGSWWVTARGTYYRPFAGWFRHGVLPSFGDVQGKVTVRPNSQTTLTAFALVGRETMGGRDRATDDSLLAQFRGRSHLGVAKLAWTPNSRLMATTIVSAYAHAAQDFDRSWGVPFPAFERDVAVRDLAAREQLTYAITNGHLLTAGMEAHRVRSSWRMAGLKPPIFWRGIGPSTWGELVEYPPAGAVSSRLARTQVGFWLQDLVPIGSRATIEPGIRLDRNSLTGEAVWQPRLRIAARLAGTAVWAGYAAQSQTPSHESLQGFDYYQFDDATRTTLQNERSRQVVAGFERSLAKGTTIRVEAYRRRFDRLLIQRLETDAERALRVSQYALPPDLPPDSVILEHRPTVYPESTGRGTAAGIETLLQHNGSRLNGHLAYSFSRTRREAYGYSFPFDFDRPHALSAAATLRLTGHVRVSSTWFRTSGFAVTPLRDEVFFFHTQRPDGTLDPIARSTRRADGTLLMAPDADTRRLSVRNSDRLSSYSRVDVRATYSTLGRWEFYGEVINLFGARNYRQLITGPEPTGSGRFVTNNNVYENFERIPSFGVRVRF
jgi:TonB dependent receptor-like, beta-barrel